MWKSLSLNSNIESWNDHMYDAQWWTHLSSTFEWMSTYHDKKKSNNTEFDLPYFLPVFTPFQFLLKWEGEQQINIITNDIHQLTPARLLRIFQQLWTYVWMCVHFTLLGTQICFLAGFLQLNIKVSMNFTILMPFFII